MLSIVTRATAVQQSGYQSSRPQSLSSLNMSTKLNMSSILPPPPSSHLYPLPPCASCLPLPPSFPSIPPHLICPPHCLLLFLIYIHYLSVPLVRPFLLLLLLTRQCTETHWPSPKLPTHLLNIRLHNVENQIQIQLLKAIPAKIVPTQKV